MTAEPIRDIGFAAWKDPDAWMEAMKGEEWNKLLTEENKRVKDVLQSKDAKAVAKQFRPFTPAQKSPGFIFQSGEIEIEPTSGFFLNWRWKGSIKKHEVHDVVAEQSLCISTHDIGKGSLLFELVAMSKHSSKPLWKQSPVGPEVGIVGDWCLYLGVENKLWSNELWACNKKTGENAVRLYRETDPRWNCTIVRGESKSVFLVREDAQVKETYQILPTLQLKQVKDIYSTEYQKPRGSFGICWVSAPHQMMCTKTHGSKTLWKLHKTLEPTPLAHIPAGSFTLDPWAIHEGRCTATLLLETPDEPIRRIAVRPNHQFQVLDPMKGEFEMFRRSTKSKDGTSVYYVVVHKRGQPIEHAIINGYGAYGLETHAVYVAERWNPLVQNNWAIVYCFIRGGGDHTEEWGKVGRRHGREKTVDDFVACIQSVKKSFKLAAKDIVLYGRSAGGVLVGNALMRAPTGTLFGGIFAEVPYVDVLRTTTNPDLPLTRMETNEFGDPTSRLEDFLSVGLMSPADAATTLATPNVFVFCKTAVNDTQVYAYEPIKWVRRLRAVSPKGQPKLVSIEMNSGHFTPPASLQEETQRDCILLQTLVA